MDHVVSCAHIHRLILLLLLTHHCEQSARDMQGRVMQSAPNLPFHLCIFNISHHPLLSPLPITPSPPFLIPLLPLFLILPHHFPSSLSLHPLILPPLSLVFSLHTHPPPTTLPCHTCHPSSSLSLDLSLLNFIPFLTTPTTITPPAT